MQQQKAYRRINTCFSAFQENIQVFDDIEAEALAMSDMIASTIVMQFLSF
ncbi:hypothetical protein JNUCC51_18000 [Lysinibacillus sp. JNUCC 51]|nr:hypothetical protein JNUCC51_18000 [Lysinibacillus sp. JNUCC-51]